MKQVFIKIFLLTMGMLTASPIFSQTIYIVKSQSLVVSGTSNLHDWTADVQNVNGVFKVKVENGKITDLQEVDLNVDAKSLKGSKGSIMDSKINDALKSEKFPKIYFKSTKIQTVTNNSGLYQISTNGILTIAGTSQNISIDATGKVLPNGEIEFTGTKKIKMTDYKVEPPTAMFGALTTADEVTITFKVTIKSQN